MTDLYRYRDIAFFSAEKIRQIQQKQLREHLRFCGKHSGYYRKLLKDAGINYNKITLEQLPQLPFTDKAVLESRNDDFCAVPAAKIVDIVFSSGTTGKPIKMFYTDYDLRRLAYNEEKSFAACGISPADIVLLTCTMDRCFIAGLAYFLGIRALGAAAVRSGNNSLESHLEIMKRAAPTVLIGVPGFLKRLGLYLKGKGVEPSRAGVSRLVCIGEPLRGEGLKLLKVADDLQNIWQAQAFSTYASSEIITTFCECAARQGGHLHPDLAIVEIVDDKGNSLAPGGIGEIVVTPMAVEGMPLVRFKTGDVSFLIDKPCSCGRNSIRLGPILGRKKQMMKVRGTTLYPQSIYSTLEEIPGIEDYYIDVSSESELCDNITIYVAVKDKALTPRALQDKLRARLRVKPAVTITDKESIKRQVYGPKSRKPVRFIDRRESNGLLHPNPQF